MAIETLIDPKQLQADLEMGADLSNSMRSQAGMFAHYAVLAARAQKQASTAKVAMEIKESVLDREIRQKAAETGSKLTEPLIAKEIARSVDYIRACNAYNEATMIADLAKNTLEAWKQRRDMLVQLGVAAREEMKGELYIKAREHSTGINPATRDAALQVIRTNQQG